ncbi:hypothetical protein ERUR111494_04835 [Erysipelothrix urinaevulpis]|uniref:hypothetical protein n=1 Tax=Erysipelothrix urinaevulpis TaxID=2683717 RepID=UPI001358AA24|nr:hypothetical protein [Erysipelothrix urinaevulpis]
MKATLEFYGLWLLICVFLLTGINLASLTQQLNQAHQFRNYLIYEIDNHHGYNETIEKSAINNPVCQWCESVVYKEENRYKIEIKGEIKTLFFNFKIPIHLKSFTNMIF